MEFRTKTPEDKGEELAQSEYHSIGGAAGASPGQNRF